MVAGIERGLQDAGREDNFILGWKVVGIHCLRGHAPPGDGGRREREAAALDSPAAPPRPAALTYLLQGPVSLVWDQLAPSPSPGNLPCLSCCPKCLRPSILTGPGWEAFGAGQPSL